MASTFNLLTAGGARFDKRRFKQDFELFEASKPKQKGKGKEKQRRPSHSTTIPSNLNYFASSEQHPAHAENNDEDIVSDAESSSSASSSSSSSSRPEPPKQKITLTGSEPLPKSLHSNLPSLITHETTALPSSSGGPILSALKAADIHSLWGVQCAVAGCILEGRDTMCIAPTGSGKTLSYLLPTLVRLRDPARKLRGTKKGRGIRSLVVVPTHDLAIQINAVLKAVTRGRAWRCLVLSKATEKAVMESAAGVNAKIEVEDGEDGDEELGSDDDEEDEENDEVDKEASEVGDFQTPLGVDFLVATPERLHHLLSSQMISLQDTQHLILDEADRLVSPDFLPQVEPIIKAVPATCQKTFLSATIPSGSEAMTKKWMNDGGVRVVVGVKDSAVSTVSQSLLYTGSESGKLLALRNMVAAGDLPYPSLIFVQSVARADELYKELLMDGLRVGLVHGDRPKARRDEAIQAFREGTVWMLIVTDVLARGMDFRGVKMVINYDFPQSTQSYIHRIGRTGRAGLKGKAITFFNNDDAPYLRTTANILRASGCEVPEYMLELPKPSKNLKRRIAKIPIKRKDVGGGGRDVGRERAKRKKEMIQASKRRKAKSSEEKAE